MAAPPVNSPLYNYQWDGVTFLQTHRRAYLADEMGLGKTPQAIVAARFQKVGHILVVAPASTIPNWRAEFARWWPGKRVPIISYAKLAREKWKRRVEGRDWGLVILDEAHYCKSVSALRTRAALSVARDAARAWLLSGTPMPNDPQELWAPVKYLWPELAKARGITRKDQWLRYFTKYTDTQYGPRVYAANHTEQLRADLRTFMLRRRTRDVLKDLPPLRVNVHRLEADNDWPAVRAEIEGILEEFGSIEGLEDLGKVPPEHIATVRRILGAYKAPRVARQVEEELDQRQYRKVVLLAHHRDTIEILRRALQSWEPVGFTGSTPIEERAAAIEQFQSDRLCRVFIGQQTAAGVGINLQAASEVVLVEPSWSPADNQQAVKRIHRIGQDSPCRARIFAIDGSLDEAIMERLAEKTQMSEEVGL